MYNVWQKVLNPTAILPQMTSDTQLPPFYFGGSPMPMYLQEKKNISSGIRGYKRGGETEVSLSKQGSGIKSIYHKRI